MRSAFPGMLALALALAMIWLPAAAYAQCRMGSGPDHDDGIPYCSDLPPPAPPQRDVQPERPGEWMNFAAAVVWAGSAAGDQFIGVGKYFDEQAAADSLIAKCRTISGWSNCTVALSVTNGVIAVGRDSAGRLRVRRSPSRKEAQDGLLEKCRSEGETCRIVATFDGLAERF